MAGLNEPLSGDREDGEEVPEPAGSSQDQPLRRSLIYYVDRTFLCFLALLLLLLSLEVFYKIWYLTPWATIYTSLRQLAQWLSESEGPQAEL